MDGDEAAAVGLVLADASGDEVIGCVGVCHGDFQHLVTAGCLALLLGHLRHVGDEGDEAVDLESVVLQSACEVLLVLTGVHEGLSSPRGGPESGVPEFLGDVGGVAAGEDEGSGEEDGLSHGEVLYRASGLVEFAARLNDEGVMGEVPQGVPAGSWVFVVQVVGEQGHHQAVTEVPLPEDAFRILHRDFISRCCHRLHNTRG